MRHIALFGCLCWAIFLSGGESIAQSRSVRFITPDAALRHGFEHSWLSQAHVIRTQDEVENVGCAVIPIEGKESLTLFVQTKRGTVEAVDGETGRGLWNIQVGNPNYPTYAPAMNKNVLAAVNGSTMYVYNLLDGRKLWEVSLEKVPTAPPAISDEWVYLSTLPNFIWGYSLVKPDQVPWKTSSVGELYLPPLVTSRHCVWGTSTGDLHFCDAKTGEILRKLETGGEIPDSPAVWEPIVVTVTREGYVHGIDDSTGKIAWRFSSRKAVGRSPITMAGKAFILLETGGVHCLDALTGEELWFAPGITGIVSVGAEKTYAVDQLEQLVMLDNRTGERRDSLAIPLYVHRVVNRHNDRVFLVSSTGLVQCLGEGKAPLLHPQSAPPSTDQVKPKEGEKPAAEEEKK